MAAVLLTGNGGLDRLEYRTDVPVPTRGAREVLIRVSAAGANSTDINTRVGWSSKAVTSATEAIGAMGAGDIDAADAAWSGAAVTFPRIQGADCCGRIVAMGEGVPTNPSWGLAMRCCGTFYGWKSEMIRSKGALKYPSARPLSRTIC